MRRRTEVEPVTEARVDLLSPWVHDRLRARRLSERFGLGLLALVLLLAAGWTYQRVALAQAEADLRGEKAAATTLQQQIADLGPVQQYVDGVDRRARTVQELMLTDVAFSDVLAALADATPGGASIDALAIDLPTPAVVAGLLDAQGNVTDVDLSRGLLGASCPGPDPFATLVVVGCLTISGTAVDRSTVGRLVEELDRSKEFVEPFISTTTTTEGSGVTFTGSVALDPKVFSGRYDDLRVAVGLAEEADADAGSTDPATEEATS